MTKEEMLQLADAQLRYETALMEARTQYEQRVLQVLAWVRSPMPLPPTQQQQPNQPPAQQDGQQQQGGQAQ